MLAGGSGFGEGFFQAFHAGAGGGLWDAHGAAGLRLAAVPVGLKAHGKVIAIALEGFELADPVDDPSADRRPLEFAVGLADSVFAVAVAYAMLGQRLVVVGVGRVAGEGGGVTGIPVEHQVGLADRLEHGNGFRAAAGVASHFVFKNQDVVLRAGAGGIAELFIDGVAIGLLIVETPEVEAADAVSLECLAELDAAFEYLVLLLEVEVGVELIAAGPLLRLRRAGPVDLEERAGNVSDLYFSRIWRDLSTSSALSSVTFLFHMLRSSIQLRPKSLAATEHA